MDSLTKDNFDREEDVLKKIFQWSASEPTSDLKRKILQDIRNSSQAFEYRPVIGRKAWIAMGTAFVALVSFLLLWDHAPTLTSTQLGWPGPGFLTEWDISTDKFVRWFAQQHFDMPFAFKIAIGAFVMFGIHFIVSLKFESRYFGSSLQRNH